MKPRFLSCYKFQYNKTWVVMGLALGVGLIAALAARSYLAAQIEAIESRTKGTTVSLIVAKGDIKKGDTLSLNNLAVRQIPVEYAQSAALPPNSFERLNGKVIAYAVKSGEMMFLGMMEHPKAATFSARIDPGHRAITVPVDEINSISGMLEPEDLIDLILSVEHGGVRSSYPLLQKMKVIATGQRSIDDGKTGERRQFSTVTLDATPQQAQSIIMAREAGKLTALLRNPGDQLLLPSQPSQPTAKLASGGPAKRSIPILYGGASAHFAAESLKLLPTPAALLAASTAAANAGAASQAAP